ncbi:MAG: carbonic anhydrase [Candidatus Melainabacteria bacterium]|nr:MAG: carbonic anhydrase [Candidatus Melainabacteria bacterium]
MKLPLNFRIALTLIAVSCSMQAAQADPTETQKSLDSLTAGNIRYLSGKSTIPRVDPERREITATEGQFPIATILGCSDARVPPEIIFDQKFGKLFVIRVAGNVTGISEIASAEYGVHYLKTPLVVVLGHSSCGAVNAAVENTPLKGKLPKLVGMIQPAVDEARKNRSKSDKSSLVDDCIKQNVRYQMKKLLEGSDLISGDVKTNKVKVVGAIRDIKTGKVQWLDDKAD